MRNLLPLIAVVLAGCGASSDDADASVKPGSGVAANPSGKPQNEEQAQRASEMQKQGEMMSAQQQKDAEARKAAMAQTGGK